MKTLFILAILLSVAFCGPPGFQAEETGGTTGQEGGQEGGQEWQGGQGGQEEGFQQQKPPQTESGTCGISRCTHGSRTRYPQPYNCMKFLESGHHGEDVLLEKSCTHSKQFNPMTCKCDVHFDCSTCTDRTLITGNGGQHVYRIQGNPHEIRCPRGEHFCDQSLHCVPDGDNDFW